MKKILLSLFIAFFFLSLSSVAQRNTIIIKNGKFTINNTTVTPDWNYNSLNASLGTIPTSKSNFYVHTYDELGVVLFEGVIGDKANGEISEIQIYHATSDDKNSPNLEYSGLVKIDKLVANTFATPAIMRQALKGWTESKCYTAHTYRLERKGIYIYFTYNSPENLLIRISIGKASN